MNPIAITAQPPQGFDKRHHTTTEDLSLSFRIILAIVMIWTLIQILAPVPFLPTGVRRLLVGSKVLFGPFVLMTIIVMVRPSLYIPKGMRGIVWFCGLSVLLMVLRREPTWWRIALMVTWAACFVLFPSLLNSRARVKLFTLWSLRTLLYGICLVMVFAIANDSFIDVTSERTRYYFGINPNYFASIATMLACAGLALHILTDKGKHRALIWTAILGGTGMVVLTNSRTFILFLVLTFITYARSIAGVWKRIAQVLTFSAWVAVGAALLIFGTNFLPENEINKLSSGRVFIWRQLVIQNVGAGEAHEILLGRTTPAFDKDAAGWRKLSGVYADPFESGKKIRSRFVRVAFDNAFLDVLLFTGVVGFLAVLWAWLHWWNWVSSVDPRNEEERQCCTLIKAVLIGLIVSSFFGSSWPTISNVQLTFGFLLLIGLTTVMDQRSGATPSGMSAATPSAPKGWNPPGRIR